MTNTSVAISGWVSEPDGRGTWGILSTCLLTIILCCWTSVCPNIPAPSDGYFTRMRDKLHLALMGVLGPEFLLMLTLGQWTSARTSVKVCTSNVSGALGTMLIIFHKKRFTELGYSDWTMVHGFYADMGGFVLHGPGIRTPFPIDAEQLRFLLEHEYIEYPRIAKEDINDRNKSDGFARCIAVFQAVWMVVNCLTRAAQGLALTTLELTTMSFILVFLVTSFCWYHKPLDISTTVPIHTVFHINQILAEVRLFSGI